LSLLCWLVFGLILRSVIKGALAASFFLLLFYSHGHLYNLLWYFFAVRPFTFGAEYILLPLWGILLSGSVMWFILTKRDLAQLNRWVNYVAIILLAISVFSVGLAIATVEHTALTEDDRGLSRPNVRTSSENPDIYYIILDGFARADILAELYHLPRSRLVEFLAQRGFFVARRAGANYCQTDLSLASSLNFKYLDPAKDGYRPDSADRIPLKRMIAQNRVTAFLRDHGYTTVAFASGYEPTTLRNADIFLEPVGKAWFLDEFQSGLLQTTPLPHIIPEMYRLPFIGGLSHPQADSRRRMLRRTMEMLGEMPARRSPKFVFAHLVTPHPPFLFGPHGEEIDPQGVFDLTDGNAFFGRYGQDRSDYITGYRNQLQYVETLVIDMVAAILENSAHPPVIILQADHGPGAYLDWNDSNRTNMRERLGILNAYYLPDGGDSLLYDTITPVNSFRVIFNCYFDAQLELLPDESYFSLWHKPYWFVPVGRAIKGDTSAPTGDHSN